MSQLVLTSDLEQAEAIATALEVYARLCMGQFEQVASLVADGTIPIHMPNPGGRARAIASPDRVHVVSDAMAVAMAALGYSPQASHGILHEHVSVAGKRAYEAHKAIAAALQKHRDPGSSNIALMRQHMRCTDDPTPPLAEVVE